MQRPTVYAIDGLVPVIDPTAFVHPTAVLIGDVIVGPGCYVGPCASLRGDFGRLVLQAGVNVQDTCVLHSFPEHDTVIEENGHIGHGAVIHCCTIRRNALVGMNAVVMDNAVIGESAIVAACAFVKAGMEIPARTLAAESHPRPVGAGNGLEGGGHAALPEPQPTLPEDDGRHGAARGTGSGSVADRSAEGDAAVGGQDRRAPIEESGR
jgi:carbonic anhydrase/acetyltransferase-like protein (isoleucine patch superfamily)